MQLNYITLLTLYFYFCFFEALMILFLGARVFFYFLVAFYLRFFVFFFLSFYFKSSVTLVCINFVSLVLDFLRRGYWIVVFWVCTFKVILLEKWWYWEQRMYTSQTIVLDCKPDLAFGLMIFCTISLKLGNAWFCYFISTLKESLSSYRK